MGKGTEIELKNLGSKVGIKLISDDDGKVVIATEDDTPLQPTKPDGKLDEFAIHDNEAEEFSPLTEKGAPASTDLVMIEDSEDGFAKKKVQVGNIGGGGSSSFLGLSDTPNDYVDDGGLLVAVNVGESALEFIDPATLPVASHSHTESDITDLGAYLDQTAADLLYAAVGHDHSGVYSEPGHAHVEADITDLDHTDGDAVHLSVDDEFSGLTQKGTPVAADKVLLEDSEAAGAKKWAPFSAFGGGGGGFPEFGIPHYDKGSGELEITCSNNIVVSVNSDPRNAKVCALDVIRSMHGGAASPSYTYYMRREGGSYGAGNSDPTAEAITFTTVDAGVVLIWTTVFDGDSSQALEVQTAVVVTDLS